MAVNNPKVDDISEVKRHPFVLELLEQKKALLDEQQALRNELVRLKGEKTL